MPCRLCGKNKPLCDSHIVPEFLYKDLYNENHKMMGINGQGNKGWKPLQQGLYEKLLCESCEQFFNDEYEKPFLQQWTITSPLPDRMREGEVYAGLYDYPKFKLFHLSVLFRASVSSLPSFAAVRLGKHEERIREMLVTKNPGKVSDYPIFGMAVINMRDEVQRRHMTSPESQRFEGHIAYGQIYGGAMWWVSVSSHCNTTFCKVGLQSTGHMHFNAVPWNQIPIMRAASEALRRARPT